MKKAAFDRVADGFHVFPIKPGHKFPPLMKKWGEKATQQKRLINLWWGKLPKANIGIATGPSGLLVVDIDAKKKGYETISQLELEHGALPTTYTVSTPNGGLHYYYSTSEPIRNSVEDLGRGIDTRGTGGYVVGVGSRTADGYYILQNSADIAVCPEWIGFHLRNAGHKSSNRDDDAIDELDTISSYDRAKAFAQSGADPAIEGEGGDLRTFKVAAQMRDLGISSIICLNLMAEYYNPRCEPSWDIDELERKITSAYRNAQNQGGSSDVTTMFGPYKGPMPKIKGEKPTFSIHPASDFDFTTIPPRQWVLGTRLISGYVTVTLAPGGVGKSTHTLLEALSVAAGEPYSGITPHKSGKVLIYNTEDPRDEIFRRLYAACIYHKIDSSVLERVYVESGIEQPLIVARESKGNVIFPKRAREFEDICKKEGFVAIFLDPFVRTHRINENDNSQMDTVMNYFSRIAIRTGAAISLVHHTRKSQSGETIAGNVDAGRGASALVDAARIASTLTCMSAKEAEAVGLPATERYRHLRLDNAKGNMAPPAIVANWFTMVSVELPNGDSVGVLEAMDSDHLRSIKSQQYYRIQLEYAQILIPFVGQRKKKSTAECATFLLNEHPHLFETDISVAALTMRLMRMYITSFECEGLWLDSYAHKTKDGSRWLKVSKDELEI